MPNYSYYAIPVAWVLAIAPHAYAIALHDSHLKQQPFDNTAPRTLVNKVTIDKSFPPELKNRIVRAEGAQQNGFENLSLFAAAVVAGNMAKLPVDTLNLLSGAYVATRFIYNFVYINNETKGTANVRSLLYLTGVGSCLTLFVMAGNALRLV